MAAIGERPVRFHVPELERRAEERIQQAAQAVLATCLGGGSAFTPGVRLWGPGPAAELHEHFVEKPNTGPGTFLTKLKSQIAGCSDTAVQLAAELQYLTILPLHDMTPDKKRDRLNQILSWMNEPVAVPTGLSAALEGGVFNGGMGFKVMAWKQFAIFIDFVAAWTAVGDMAQQEMSGDPWKFRDFVNGVPGALPAAQRYELMYLAYPDVFDPIVNHEHRKNIRKAFADVIGGATGDLDRDLYEIRNTLEEQQGDSVEFYSAPLVDKWKVTKPPPSPVQRGWFVRAGRTANQVSEWLRDGVVRYAVDSVPVDGLVGSTQAQLAAKVSAQGGGLTYNQRSQLSEELDVFLNRMQLGDLVVALDHDAVYGGTIHGAAIAVDGILQRSVEWMSSGSAVAIDDLQGGLAARLQTSGDIVELSPLEVRLLRHQFEDEDDTATQPLLADVTDDLSRDLMVGKAWLQECVELLRDRPQLVFYGPPGTGKTYVAQRLAWHLAGREGTTLVQFHPAYTYEDFFEGYRPVPGGSGTLSFDLRPGPFRRVVDQATKHPDLTFVLIIDEVNRGNLARIFGELYFLLEYRDAAIELLYSATDGTGRPQTFTLPSNVVVLATMNSSDRSIALVDAAMRRRFSFVSLHPADEPVKSLLATWLARTGREPDNAVLLDRLNEQIGDPDFAIGPSYFMRPAVYAEGGLARMWRTSILPLLEEHHYGDGVDVAKRYALNTLLAPSAQAGPSAAAVGGAQEGAPPAEGGGIGPVASQE